MTTPAEIQRALARLLRAIARREMPRGLPVVARQRLVSLVGNALAQALRGRTRRAARRRSGCWRRGSRAACPARSSRSTARPWSARPPSDCGRRRRGSGARRRAGRGDSRCAVATPPPRRRATRVAIRRAAASRKWPEPQAGSMTRSASSASAGVSDSPSTRSSTGSSAVSSSA